MSTFITNDFELLNVSYDNIDILWLLNKKSK